MYAAFVFLQRFNVPDDFTKHEIIKASLLVQLVGQKNFFANVSVGYAHGMYYLPSSGLEWKVRNKRTTKAKITSQINHTLTQKLL